MITCECRPANRFEIEKKLREAKRVENRRQKVAQTASASVSQRSKDRRKVVEDKKDNKKVSALQDLKARREEKKKQGKLCTSCVYCVSYFALHCFLGGFYILLKQFAVFEVVKGRDSFYYDCCLLTKSIYFMPNCLF